MGLMSALNAAVSGLRTTQAGINLVSQNVANADSIGYTRRRLAPVEVVAGDRGAGVRTGEIERVLDRVAQRQLRLETAGAAYTGTLATFTGALDRLFGSPGSAGSLDFALNEVTNALRKLADNPGDVSSRATVVDKASVLAARLGSISEGVQELRSQAEGRIASAVTRANELLSGITEINKRIVAAQTQGGADPALLDERDRYVGELSQLMDVQAFENQDGSIRLATTGGQTLFDGVAPVKLTFDARALFVPQMEYAGAASTVGVIRAVSGNGTGMDLIASRAFRSGEIAAALELRDEILPQAQRQLDELAAGLASALSETRVTGSQVGTGYTVGLTGLMAGDVIEISYVTAAGERRDARVLVQSGGLPALPASTPAEANRPVLAVEFGAPPGGAANLQAALGGGFIVSGAGTGLNVTPGAGESVLALAFVKPGTLAGGGGTNPPLLVDRAATDPVYGGVHPASTALTGLSQRLAVNSAVAANPALINGYGALAGDSARALAMVDNLTAAPRVFSAASGVRGTDTPYASSVADFARRVVETQGANAETAQRLDEGQRVALATIEARFAEFSGVNIDQEMAQLVQLQTAYGANARVMTAVRDMMDLLLRI